MGVSHGWVKVNTHSTPVPGSPGRLWVAHRSIQPHQPTSPTDFTGPESTALSEEMMELKGALGKEKLDRKQENEVFEAQTSNAMAEES